jgi:hypothetical protein
LTRSTGFETSDVQLVREFVSALREKLVAADQPFFNYLVDKCTEDVVTRSVRHSSFDDELLPSIVGLLRRWAIETYEAHSIVAAIGVEPSPDPASISAVHVGSLAEKGYAKVLSNGVDTLIVLSPSGHVVEHKSLSGRATTYHSSTGSFAPRRYLALADWAAAGRVAFALNHHGEILVFKSRQLKFAFRAGQWSHFAHAAMIARMGAPSTVMRAVYASCLDVSFARTGGCVAIARSVSALGDLLNKADLLASPSNDRSRLLKHLIGRRFTAIPRAIREELAALDGATVLNRVGAVIAAGAIVRVPGGSEGGGRLAAAKALSRLGLAVKISADGGISAFSGRGKDREPELAFQVSV